VAITPREALRIYTCGALVDSDLKNRCIDSARRRHAAAEHGVKFCASTAHASSTRRRATAATRSPAKELLNHFACNDIVNAIEGPIEQGNDVRTLH